jgi:hypothetical protein
MRDVWVGTLDGESLIRMADMESVRVSGRRLEARTRTWGTVVLAEGDQDALARAAGELLDLASPLDGDDRLVVRARTRDGVLVWEIKSLDAPDEGDGFSDSGSVSTGGSSSWRRSGRGNVAKADFEAEWLAERRPPQ